MEQAAEIESILSSVENSNESRKRNIENSIAIANGVNSHNTGPRNGPMTI